MFSALMSNIVKKCIKIGYCAVSEIKVEAPFLLEIPQCSDHFLLKEQHQELHCDLLDIY